MTTVNENLTILSTDTYIDGVIQGETKVQLNLETPLNELYNNKGELLRTIRKVSKVTGTLTAYDITTANILLGFAAQRVDVEAGADGSYVAMLEPGKTLFLPHQGISAVTVTRVSDSTPLAEATDYTYNAPAGTVSAGANLSAAVQVAVAYSYSAQSQGGMFTQPQRSARLDWISTSLYDNSVQRFGLFKAEFKPITGLDLTADDFNNMPFEFSAVAVQTGPYDAMFGKFGYAMGPLSSNV